MHGRENGSLLRRLFRHPEPFCNEAENASDAHHLHGLQRAGFQPPKSVGFTDPLPGI